MKNVGGSDAAGKIAIDVYVVGIENFLHIHHRGNRDAAFIDGLSGNVRMAIDNSGNHELPRSVDDLGACRSFDGLPDFGDFSIPNKDGTMLDRSVRNG